MKQSHWVYTCDWCGVTETKPTETLPENWKLVLIGTDSRGPNKWESKMHLCHDCDANIHLLLKPDGYDADKD